MRIDARQEKSSIYSEKKIHVCIIKSSIEKRQGSHVSMNLTSFNDFRQVYIYIYMFTTHEYQVQGYFLPPIPYCYKYGAFVGLYIFPFYLTHIFCILRAINIASYLQSSNCQLQNSYSYIFVLIQRMQKNFANF